MRVVILFCLLLTAWLGFQAGSQSDGVLHDVGPPPRVFFCDKDNCSAVFATVFANTSPDCAFFELDDPIVVEILHSSRVVTDGREEIELDNVQYDKSGAYMHNKFCVAENIVWTGSWNPTISAADDRNNVMVIESELIADVYQQEFDELWSGTFHGGRRSRKNIVTFNNSTIQVFFCPEDNCQQQVNKELLQAKNTIYFMTFSFTDEVLLETLTSKFNEGIHVEGYFEPFLRRHSHYDALKARSVPVYLEDKKGFLHHKVFIIDNQTVITGSYNPTRNGNERNDENVLIVKDERVAALFVEEFLQGNA